MRVLLADDSAFMRQALARAIGQQPKLELVGRAKDGREAVQLAKELKPDAISLDIEMPEMDGLTALRHIMRESPCRVLMCSSLTTEGSTASLQALRMGAADVLAKENGATLPGGQSFHDEYVRRLVALAESQLDQQESIKNQTNNKKSISKFVPPRLRDIGLVCIGSSTGGPPVLETILAAFKSGFPAPIVVAQHMPAVFTQSMAARLSELCELPVVHAEHGTAIRPGQIHVCPGNQHSHVVSYAGSQLRLKVNDEPKSDLYHPSVDALFHSAADAVGRCTLAMVLTGIGEDGAKGAQALREKGATILAQDRASSVVYGMPRAIADRQLADAVMNPTEIAALLRQIQTPAKAA